MNKLRNDDYPAAHSMDAEWFAIDDAGEVAWLNTGEYGAIPVNGLPGVGFFEMLGHLEKDEHGIPLLPTPGDHFAQGRSTELLDQELARLWEGERARLAALASDQALSHEDKLLLQKLKKSWGFGHAVVLLADAADAASIKDSLFVVRLDPVTPLYHVGRFSMIDGLRLHSLGRVLAFRQIEYGYRGEFEHTLGLPGALGVYCFSADFDSEERTDADGQTVRLPPRYERKVIPEMPRIGMPAVAAHGGIFVHALPGVRFAEVTNFQLADCLPYKTWDQLNPPAKKGE